MRSALCGLLGESQVLNQTSPRRGRTVAMWVRLSVRCEDPGAPASLLAQLHRFADQVGLTTAGLAEMGWKVAVDEVAPRRASRSVSAPRRERRLRAADAQ